MKRTIFLALGLIASVSIARWLPATETSHRATAHNLAGILGHGVAGCPQETPSFAKQQFECARLRPVFQASATAECQGAAPRNQEFELVILDQSHSLKCGLYRVSFGRAPPLDRLR